MPFEKEQLDGADKDLGTSPLVKLPQETFSCANVKRIGVVTGKSGKTYFLNLDDLGGYQTGPNKGDAAIFVYQQQNSVYSGAAVYPREGGYVYIHVVQFPTTIFKFSCDAGGNPQFTYVGATSDRYVLVLVAPNAFWAFRRLNRETKIRLVMHTSLVSVTVQLLPTKIRMAVS